MSTGDNIKGKAKTSMIWSSVEHFGAQGIGFLITLVVARLVTPADYGLIAMLSIFMAVSQTIINSGFSNYLIQKQDRSSTDLSTVFYMNILLGLSCYGLLFFSAGAIAGFYNQAPLSNIIKVYSLTLIVSSLTLVQRTIIYINNEYKKLSAITIISIFTAGITTIILAYRGWGVWALVAYNLLQASLSSIGIWITTKWHPRLVFSTDSLRAAFNFGGKLLGANLLSNAVSNVYTLVIGKVFNVVELGYYSRGQSIAYIFPSNFSNILQQATYPVLCELQEDKEKLKGMFEKYIMVSAFITFPLLFMLIGIAEPLIRLLLTDKWIDAVFFVQVLSIAYMFDPIMRMNSIILSVTGRTQLSLYSEVCKKTALVIFLFATIPFGIKWVSYGVILYSLTDLVIVSRFVKEIIPITFWEEIKIILSLFFYSVCSFIILVVVNLFISGDIFKIIIGLILFASVYLLLIRAFSFNKMRFILSFITNLRISHG